MATDPVCGISVDPATGAQLRGSQLLLLRPRLRGGLRHRSRPLHPPRLAACRAITVSTSAPKSRRETRADGVYARLPSGLPALHLTSPTSQKVFPVVEELGQADAPVVGTHARIRARRAG